MRLRSLVSAVFLTCALVEAPLAQTRPGAPAPGAATGRINGKVFERGREPAAFVNVIVLGTKQGTQTDENGAFAIGGIPVGEVQIQVQAIGFDKMVKTVQVNAGQIAAVEFVLGESKVVKQIEEIEVRAQKVIDTKSSSSRQSISAEKLREIPVDNIREAVAVKAGVVAQGGELHFRGGRGGEVKFQFDGVEVSDPLFGGGAGIANLAVAGAEVLTGGLDAEYGNALSGVVALSTKEGSDKFGGEVRWDTDRYGDPTKTFNNFDRFTFGFGGPTSIKNLTYFSTYEGSFTDTYTPMSISRPSQTLFDFVRLGNRQRNEINTNLKLAYRVNTRHKVTLETINNHSIATPYNHMWSRQGFVQVAQETIRTVGRPNAYREKFGRWSALQEDSTFRPVNMPDHLPTTDNSFHGLTAVWTNQLSDKSVMTSRLSSHQFSTHSGIGRKAPWEYYIQSPQYWDGNTTFGSEDNLFYATHGDFPTWSDQKTKTYVAKTDLSTRRWKQHTFKTGVEARYNRVQKLTLTLPNNEVNGLPGGARSDFINYNPEGAFYIQDRWEYEGLVLNAGIRYDMFTPGDQIETSELSDGKRWKQQASPRLGIAYPISDKDVLSFHYGWTYQTPGRNFIFENRGLNAAVGTQGNPDLEPETNVSYQAAVQHLFSRDVSGQFAVFFRDIYGLLTTRADRDSFGNQISVFENADYASARGFEASIVKSFSHKFSAEINYTYQIASGVASNPNEAQQFLVGNRLYLPISEQPLDWDQRNTLTIQGSVRDPGRWGLRFLWQYGSGFPYTPTFRNNRRQDPALQNSRNLPSSSTLTLDADKYYRIWGQNVTLFVDARNVLNAKNINGLTFGTFPNPFVNQAGDEYMIYFTETGRAGGAYLDDVNGDNVLDWVPLRDPRVFQEGRNVRMGVSITF